MKFDGLLFCSDLDDTLLTTDKRISDKNIEALKYFMDNGGLFTFATGRVPEGARLMLEYIRPNAPIVCFNGAALYDFEKEEYIWQAELPKRALKAVEFIDKEFPPAGIEVCTDKGVYFCKANFFTEEHKLMEKLPDKYLHYNEIAEEWRKVIFMVKKEEVETIRKIFAESEFADDFSFMRSSPWYYEMLPKGATKGTGMLRLAKHLGIKQENIFAIGDNENDLDMVKKAGIGIAVLNASKEVYGAADMITVDHNSHAAAAVVNYIESKLKNGER